MSMETCIEIGWTITNKFISEYVGPLFENGRKGQNFDDNGFFVPGTENHKDCHDPGQLYIETHPHDTKRVFVSLVTPEHGFELDTFNFIEPQKLSTLVCDYIRTLDPDAVVKFAVIETRR